MSDVDIDEELFALAGGDEEGDIEEGEASSASAPSSPADSLGSDAMEESDSDDGADDQPPARPSDVPYPLEGKFRDQADKAAVMAMPLLEREALLGERAEEMNNLRWKSELARRFDQSGPAGDRKRKASSVESDDYQRKSSRQKVKGKTESRLEAYKRDREHRDQQRQRHDDDRRNRRRSSSLHRDHSPDIDADGESEVDYHEYDNAPRQEEPADLRDFESVRVGRDFFADVCFNPNFETAIPGAFVRVGAGEDSQRRVIYKLAQIKSFTTGKPYVFQGKNGRRVATDQYVTVQYGTTKKDYNFTYLSNGRLTDADVDTYKQSLVEANGKLPTKTSIQKKYDDIKAFMDHHWTDDEITARLNRLNKFKHLLNSRHSEHAGPKLATPAELEARRIAELNSKNRALETERVRKALIEERRQANFERKQREKEYRLKKAKEEEEARKKAEEEQAKAANGDDDLFGEESAQNTLDNGTPKPAPEKKKETAKGLPTFRKPKMDDDIVASLDLGLEIEI